MNVARTKFGMIVLVLTFFFQCPPPSCLAGIATFYSYIRGSGYDASGGWLPEPHSQFSINISQPVEITDSLDHTSYSGPAHPLQGSTYARVSTLGHRLSLGASAYASNAAPWGPGEANSYASAQIAFADRVTLTGANLPSSLTFHFSLSGIAEEFGSSIWGNVTSSLQLSSGGQQALITSEGSLSTTLQASFPVRSAGGPNDGFVLDYSVSLLAMAQAASGGNWAYANGGHTAHLLAITLPNGDTPESEGISLTFDSGIISPNLLPPVPEATSLVIWSTIGCLALSVRIGKKAFHSRLPREETGTGPFSTQKGEVTV